jgi:hypothetical protein
MQAGAKNAYESVKAFSETDFTEDLKKFDIPTLILHGEDDQIVPVKASAKKSAKLIKGAKEIYYPGAPHGLTATHQDQVNADLLAFIKAYSPACTPRTGCACLFESLTKRATMSLRPPMSWAWGEHCWGSTDRSDNKSVGLAFGIGERRAHGVHGNRRYDARENESGDTNPNRKCARDRLPRYDIAITNRETGDKGEINCVPDRPAFDKANQQAQGNLNRQNCRQHRPR